MKDAAHHCVVLLDKILLFSEVFSGVSEVSRLGASIENVSQ